MFTNNFQLPVKLSSPWMIQEIFQRKSLSLSLSLVTVFIGYIKAHWIYHGTQNGVIIAIDK